MRRKLLLIPLAGAAVAAAIGIGSVFAQDGGPPPPTSGEVVANGLSATGSAVGPDGALYVPTGGTGGDQVLNPPPEAGFEGEVTFGLTATIERVDQNTGAVTTVAENLPSVAEDGEGLGAIADVEFVGSTMFFLLTGSADKMGAEDWPNGIYRVTGGGTGAELVANITEFNDANTPDFEDAIPGGNPFALEALGAGGFVVSDGNFNRLLNIAADGDVSLLGQFENVVPTGLAEGSGTAILNTWFSPAPHLPGESFVVSVAANGTVTELASGPASMIDVTVGPAGRTFVLQFSDFVADEMAPPAPTGRIWELVGSDLVLLVDGMILPTSLNFSGNTAFVTSLTGAVYQIDNFSALTPLPDLAASPTAPAQPTAPAATATPGGGAIAAPDTGTGSTAGGSDTGWLAIAALMAAGLALATGGARLARSRR